MSKKFRIIADHAFVGDRLRRKGDIVELPEGTSGDWFEDAELPAPEPDPAYQEPSTFAEHRRDQAPTTFMQAMKSKTKSR